MTIDPKTIRELKKAEARYQRSRADFKTAGAARTAAFRKASKEGMSRRGVAEAIGISLARVQQVIRSGQKP